MINLLTYEQEYAQIPCGHKILSSSSSSGGVPRHPETNFAGVDRHGISVWKQKLPGGGCPEILATHLLMIITR